MKKSLRNYLNNTTAVSPLHMLYLEGNLEEFDMLTLLYGSNIPDDIVSAIFPTNDYVVAAFEHPTLSSQYQMVQKIQKLNGEI